MDALLRFLPRLVSFGPWSVLGFLSLFLLLGGLSRLFASPKAERQTETLMHDMNGLFEKNLVYFEKTANNADNMVVLLRELNATQHLILNEMIRNNNKGY